MSTMFINFIVGLLGLLSHIYLKYVDAKRKSLNTFDFFQYINNNYKRIIVSFVSYLFICFLYIIRIYTQFELPNTVIQIIDSLNLHDMSYTWFVIGYLSDSIVRNIVKVIMSILELKQTE